ncbi:Ankyrin repeat-containing domain [Phytophthora cactorum]|nr:Ankyrin repeat-containing domain [Phytophthora cactorum]
MDMRSKAYPALPDGRGLLLVIPRVGDLRFRPQIPAAFTQRLYIHADPRRRFWYARFQLRRKFIVMSTQGDLYAKTSQNVLSMPRVARGDLVKVLDLVQCSRSEGQQWELVFTRWRNGMETWLPVEVFNSTPGKPLGLPTEVELWLFHPEFQEFYKRLRQKRAGGSTASHPQQQAGNVSDRVPVKPEQTTASVNTSHTPPYLIQHKQRSHQLLLQRQKREERERQIQQQERARRLQHEQQRQKAHEELQRSQKDYQQRLRAQQEREKLLELQQQERTRQQRAKEQEQLRQRLQQDKSQKNKPAHKQTPTHRFDIESDKISPTLTPHRNEASESEDSDASADSEASEDSLSSRLTRKRRRKRLLYSQVEVDDDDDDDLPDLSQPPPATRRRNTHQGNSGDDTPDGKLMSKKRRRLRQPDSNGGESNSVEVDLTQLSDDEEETDNSVEVLTDHAVTTPVEPLEGDGNESGGGKVISELVEENGDADHDDDMDFEPSILIGEIRNSKKLMDLLGDNTGAANLPSDWKNANYENRTLAMHAARNGLVKGLCYLLDVRKVNLFETDLQSRNSLHHAALGGEDAALVGMGDLDSNFPIHYACQAINNHTVEICQLILAAQSSMLQEKSSEGFYPLMILCKAVVCRSAKDIIALMLDIDVFGDCLNQTAPNGWRPLHFAAASGNHELVTHLCNLGMCDVQYAAKESDQTALHIAAHNNDPLCVRALLLEGLNVVAKDTDGWIPMLYAENAACVQEFMHYKLTKQLSRLHGCWANSNRESLSIGGSDRMEGLLLSNPFLLRLDNKIDYVWRCIIQSIKNSPGQCSIGVENGKSGPEKQPGQKKLAFSFSRERGCFWKQFVGMGMRLEPEDFRLPMIFSIERGNTNSQGAENREGNLKLVLIRLAAGLLKEVPGLLVRGSKIALEKTPLSSGKEELAALLVGFFVLGKYRLARDKRWENAGCSFAAGFEAVLPATLELFHADELRLLFNGPETSLNALQIDWNTAVDWNMCGQEIMGDMKTWLPRLMNELVEEEQQLLLLFMTGTFQLVNERFFRSEGSSGRITVESFSETDSVLDHDTMDPTMEHKPDILRLPSYSCYEAFKKGMLGVIRHTDQAFLPE